MGDGGKGSAQRPVDWDKFNSAWDKIFGNKSDKVKVSGVPYEVEAEKLCCNGDCNQGRDCPLRKEEK
jgi:hypothetical protein